MPCICKCAAARGLFKQSQVNIFAFEAVVVVELTCVNQGHEGLTAARNDLFLPAASILGQFSQSVPGLLEWDNVFTGLHHT